MRSKKIYEQVAAHIKQMIEVGHLKPGDKLPPMNELAQQFGVSRATVREAFSSLVGMGLIDLRHGEGTFVQKIDVQTMITEPMNAALLLGQGELRDLLEVRLLLETGIVERVCERATDSGLLRVQEALERLSLPHKKADEWVAADLQFHLALAECTGNLVLVNLMNTLSETIRSLLHKVWEAAGERERLIAEHRALYEAVAAKDALLATRLIAAHLAGSERTILSVRS